MRNETVSQTKTKVNKRTMSKLNKNKRIIGYILCIYFALGLGSHLVLASPVPTKSTSATQLAPLVQLEIKNTVNKPTAIAFKHGDISWLPQLAAEAGWPKRTWKRLGTIILRESGGCPNRIGSSIVDENCNITGWTKATNKSDSGLLQINGVNWDPKRDGTQLLCAEHKICTQEQLLDPVTNLAAGYILYQKAGWGPWDPCQWGPAYAHRCKASN
jgi:hypothetical protein